MGFTRNLIDGIGADLHNVGGLVWRAEGNYAPGEFGIYAMLAPLAKVRPLSLVVRAYDSSDDPSLSDSEVAVQFDFYGPAAQVVDAVDAVFDKYQGRWGGTLGGVKVQEITRTSGAPLGQDEGGNLRQTENYNLAVHRPSTHRQ